MEALVDQALVPLEEVLPLERVEGRDSVEHSVIGQGRRGLFLTHYAP